MISPTCSELQEFFGNILISLDVSRSHYQHFHAASPADANIFDKTIEQEQIFYYLLFERHKKKKEKKKKKKPYK